MKLNLLLQMLLFIAFGAPAFAQNDSTFLSHATGSLAKWGQKNPVEKVYLQLDKPYYAAGDDIWFKAYVTAGGKHELSGISGILNVELIDITDSVKQYLKLPLVNGLTWGDFKLPDTLTEGIYRVRAYTNWMRNDGTEYFYNQIISIGNALLQNPVINNNKQSNTNLRTKQAKNSRPERYKMNVQFFPESGNLVYGIDSKIAFKAVGDDGLGKDVKGIIVDEQGNEITRFNSQHLGMGVFSLLPVSGKTYKALVTYPDGTVNNLNLPEPLTIGYVLHIDNADPLNIVVKIEVCRGLITNNINEGVNLIAQSGGQVYYAAFSKSVSSSFTAVIPKSRFPSGIVQFTLFSTSGEPLNERLVFVKNAPKLKLSLSTSKSSFSPRQKVHINVDAENTQGLPAFGNFSVAVTNETIVPADEAAENTIFSNLLLTSELKGYIEKPNYYFMTDDEQTSNDLDVLMLTQGYHRFEWKRILANNYAPVAYQPESSLEISGRVTTSSRKPVPNGKVSLLSSSNGFFMLETLTDNKGYFAFKNLQFRDSAKFVIQAKTSKGKPNVKITMDAASPANTENNNNLFPQSFMGKDSLAAYPANHKKVTALSAHAISKRAIALKEVKIREKKILLNSSNLNGPGNADQVILAKDINTGCGSIAECLIGKLTAVYFKYDYVNMFYYPVMNQNGKSVLMKIMIDGILMDAETLNTIPVESIESVEVLRYTSTTSVYGFDGDNGLILINTKKGYYPDAASTPNIITYTPKGYYKAHEFYSPQYDDPKVNIKMADYRSTIYWNPNIATDKDGKAYLKYFNASAKGTYRVVIEGIDGAGNLGREVYRYEVQ